MITAIKYAQAKQVAGGPTKLVNVVTPRMVSREEFDAQILEFRKIIKKMKKELDERPRKPPQQNVPPQKVHPTYIGLNISTISLGTTWSIKPSGVLDV